ncbi:MAG: substrate-binding domain-containing protein [Rhodoferax sp.]|uniref:LacI family DNA-binding transcriptional regulator n=1 Tax=Rhodoferax sp. TaxID=50421 RepID=UPI0032666136
MGIKRLAQDLGLSIATVSRALNNHPEVSAQTRQRVQDAAQARAYAPNQSGRSLRKGRHNTIGLMLPPKSSNENYTWSLFLTLAEGIQSRIAPADLELVLFQNRDDADEMARLKRVVERRLVDGLILAGTRRKDERLDYVAAQGFPFVALGRSSSGGEHAWVDLDFEVGVAQVVGNLVARGHQRIALCTPQDDAMQGHLMRKGYRSAMRRHGLVVDNALIGREELSERGGYLEVRRLRALESPPSAVIFQSDCMAIGAYGSLHELGLQPGPDMAIFGGVLTGELARYMHPSLSGFSVDLRPLGTRLADALLARMAAQDAGVPATAFQQLWPLNILQGKSDI